MTIGRRGGSRPFPLSLLLKFRLPPKPKDRRRNLSTCRSFKNCTPGTRWRDGGCPIQQFRAIPHGQFRRVDCRRAERNLLRIRKLSFFGGLIPTSRDYAGFSYRDYHICTFPLTESSSNSGGSSSSSVTSPQQQIIQRRRIHSPPDPSAVHSTGPMYTVRWI